MFFGVMKKGLLPPPRWRTLVCLVESKGDRGPYPNPKVVGWLNALCLNRDLGHLRNAVLELQGAGQAHLEGPVGPPAGVSAFGRPPEVQEEGGTGGTPRRKKKKV